MGFLIHRLLENCLEEGKTSSAYKKMAKIYEGIGDKEGKEECLEKAKELESSIESEQNPTYSPHPKF